MSWLAVIVKIGALMGLTSVILVFLYGQSRIFFRMSEDGLLPKLLRVLHPRTRTPYLGHMVIGAAVAVVAGMVPISILGELVSIGTLFAFIIVCAAVLYLRRTRPDLPRPFCCPAVPLVPILGIASCLAQMSGLPLDTWLRLIVWLAIGLVLYFAYGLSRSALAPQPRPDRLSDGGHNLIGNAFSRAR